MAIRSEYQQQIAIREDKDREEIELLETNQKKLLTQIADYEQELYEKDQYIQRLENELGELKALPPYRLESEFQCQ